MTTVFIAGSISISRLHKMAEERIKKIVLSDLDVVVGDADGADKSIQECLHSQGARRVTVYCTGDTPRNNVAEWPIHRVHSKAKAGSRAYFTAKDLEMARNSDYGLMIWDGKSTGTLSNVIELLREKKKSVVFVNKSKEFVNIADKRGLDHLLTFMSDHARSTAEEKIDLSSKIASIAQEQFSLGVPDIDQQSSAEVAEGGAAGLADGDASQSQSMRLRSALMCALAEYISRAHLSQSQAADLFGVTQPRISDLMRGKVDLFGLDTLVDMAETARLRVEMSVQQPVDLPLTPTAQDPAA